jgi:hypothetical protein
MSLTKFLQTIEKSPIGRFFDRKRRLIEQLNPDRIYVENVRHIYNMPYFAAKVFCEMAVIDGIFEKKIGIECPNIECGRIVISVNDRKDLPKSIQCKNCEILEKDKYEFSISDVELITYYKLVK